MKCTAIILAAGQGKRMKSNVQKQFLQLGEYPVLYYSLKAFQDSPEITDIVLVCGKTEINYCKDAFVQVEKRDMNRFIRDFVPVTKQIMF